jgi:putative DNA primase/helicase
VSGAREIAAALGNARREGRGWRCRCPVHDGVSLNLADGDDGKLLAYCWGGCDPLDILAALRQRGFGEQRADQPFFTSERRQRRGKDERERRVAKARAIIRGCTPIFDTGAEIYLRSRYLEPRRGLGFHPAAPHPDGFNMPAMVAPVRHIEHSIVAAHLTFLQKGRKASIERPKIIYGPCCGGAVHFGDPEPGKWLAIAEGVENALTVAQASEMPAWAALSAGGIEVLVLPPEAQLIVICADNDAHGRGERAAQKAAARWIAEGRRVRIAMPTEINADFNDILSRGAAAEIKDIAHAAA